MARQRTAAHAVRAEYGIWPTVEGTRRLAKYIGREERILTAEHYLWACRRLAQRNNIDLEEIDGRLIVAGFQNTPPRRWILDEELLGFFGFWHASVARPETVGSPHNPDVGESLKAWRMGIPPKLWGKLRLLPYWLARRSSARRVSEADLRKLRWLAAHAGRLRWLRARDVAPLPEGFSQKLELALGRLCPELWLVAVRDLSRRYVEDVLLSRRLRVRDVDWEQVSQMQATLAGDRSGRLRAALTSGRRRERLVVAIRARGEALCPAYPSVREEFAHAVNLGRTPQELARSQGVTLTRQEAHLWLLSGGGRDPLPWLQSHLVGEWLATHHVHVQLRSLAVLRWLHRQIQRPDGVEALVRIRQFRGPGEVAAEARFIDRVDEVAEQDLEGTRQGVVAVFERTAARTGVSMREALVHDHRILRDPPPSLTPKVLGSRARVLITNAQLAAEGEELSHCVYGYGHAVTSGQSVILSLRWGQHRSTVELAGPMTCDWSRGAPRVLQHYGAHNTAPHPALEKLLRSIFRRMKVPMGPTVVPQGQTLAEMLRVARVPRGNW